MSKIFVLRVNPLLASVDSTLRFGNDNEIVIPMVVLDAIKKYNGKPEKKKIAEAILQNIEKLGINSLIEKGVVQSNGSILKVSAEDFSNISIDCDGLSQYDKHVFQTCIGIKKNNPEKQVIMVSKNTLTRIKAEMIGIQSEDFKDDLFPKLKEQYTGRASITVSKELFDKFYRLEDDQEKRIEIEDVYEYEKIKWITNMFVEIKCFESYQTALGRFDGEKIVPLVFNGEYHPYGIFAKNAGQKMLLECLLMDWEKAPLVIARGGAGTGKTYCSLAYALDMMDNGIQNRILVSSPSETVGNEQLGYLPGDMKEKFSPYLGGIKDNLSMLLGADKKEKEKNRIHKYNPIERGEYYFETGMIKVQPIGFLRGRTIVNTVFIIDETQNIEPSDIKSIVTRAAEGSKFIFLGDPSQVDNPKLNERYNGLVYLSEKMKGNPLCWQVTLNSEESVRGSLSKAASEIL